MKHKFTGNPMQILCLVVYFTLLITLLAACGNDADNVSSDTGSISFELDWKASTQNANILPAQSPGGDVCEDYGIDTVDVTVENASNTPVASESWPCSAHQGTLSGVPVGTRMILTVVGRVAGQGDWHRQMPGITVNRNQTTKIGKILMLYIGNDKTPPTIQTHYPAEDATGIIRNPVITVTFSEMVVASSVNAATCVVSDAATSQPIDCTVTYNRLTHTASITPSVLLASISDYTVFISKDIEDRASHNLATDTEWTFTTGTHTAETLVWDNANWDESVWN